MFGSIRYDNAHWDNFNDLYICNTSGEFNNDFLGDIRVDAIWPQANGNYSQMTPSGEAVNFLCVDDTPAIDEDATHVSADAVGEKDTYILDSNGFESLSGETILGVGVNITAKKDGLSIPFVRAISRQSSTDYTSSGEFVSASYSNYQSIWDRNPADGQPWELSDLNSGEFGVEFSDLI
jgi:hypothetical protein